LLTSDTNQPAPPRPCTTLPVSPAMYAALLAFDEVEKSKEESIRLYYES